MLQSLHIRNLALIREEEITFEEGLNILTGETGAGKSVVIGSVNLAMGAKADTDMIRTGEESALIELVFVPDKEQEKRLKKLDIEPEEDHTILITRKISKGKSVSRINGETVTVSRLKELSEILINVHGQNDHQTLLSAAKQQALLDDYCGKEYAVTAEKMQGLYTRERELEKQLKDMDMDSAARIRETDLLAYEIDEIEHADLKPGELAQLEKDYRRMSSAQKTAGCVRNASTILFEGSSGGESLADALGHARRELAQAAGDIEEVASLIDQMDDIDALLGDLSRSMKDAEENLVYDAEAFARMEERLNFLHRLQDKYGDSEEDILMALEARRDRYALLSDMDNARKKAKEEQEALLEEMRDTCRALTKIRRAGAEELSEKIRDSLIDCNFLDVRFEIAVESVEEDSAMRADGWDTVRFDIQTNPGEAMRPLSAIASGGELSRIMLGIRTVLADREKIDTLIFDEIDAGISGRTAWKVAEKLEQLSHEHQIICITHLPQIAAMADHHYLIEKGLEDERTLTRIRTLSEEESTGELARLLSADEVTSEVTENAKQLKERARTHKKKAGGKKR